MPPEIAAIVTRPGQDWSEEDIRVFCGWLYAPPQLRYLLRTARRILGSGGSTAGAEDAVQSFFSKDFWSVRRNWDSDRGTQFGAFFGTAFRNHCLREREGAAKARKVEKPLDGEEQGGPTVPVPAIEWDNDIQLARECVEGLGELDQAIVVRLVFLDRPHAEIAEEFGISVEACRVRWHRTRKKLRHCLEEVGVTPS